VNRKLKVLDLFSGIGGFALGLDSTGFFETVKFVEKDKYCQKVLRKNFPNIPIEEDIKNVKGKEYSADVVVGGFPCQPFSVAGKQKGTNDDRYLWPEMLRLIREIKPEFVIGENVQGIINLQNGMVLRQVQDDLESEGFEVQCFLIPASGIGAWHQRYRVWIVAHSQHNGLLAAEFRCNEEKNRVEEKHREENSSTRKSIGTSSIRKTDNEHEDVSNTNSNGEKWDKSKNRQGSRIEQNGKDDVSNTIGTRSRGEDSGNINEQKRITTQTERKSLQSEDRQTRSNDFEQSSEDVSNTDTRLSIGENEEIQTRRETIDSSSSRRGKEKNVPNTESIRSNEREPRNSEEESREKRKVGIEIRGDNSNRATNDVSNTNSSLRGGGRTITYGGENKVWRFRVEEERNGSNLRSETIRRDAVSREDVSDTNSERLQRRGVSTDLETEQRTIGAKDSVEEQQTWWQIESDLCGVPNGISYELDKDRANRIKTLGNAIVPQIAREFGLAIKKVLSDS
jgi:DNA (cytosine-5)-methyltransferase 1